MRRLLFLFLPAVGLALIELPRAPGMYPPEETNTNVGTLPPSAYMMNEPEQPYQFYYEKDPDPTPLGSSAPGTPQRPSEGEEPLSELSAAAATAGPQGPPKSPSRPTSALPIKLKPSVPTKPKPQIHKPSNPIAPDPTVPEVDGEPLGYEGDSEDGAKWDGQKGSSEWESTDGEDRDEVDSDVSLGPRTPGNHPGRQPEGGSGDSLAGGNVGYPSTSRGAPGRSKPSTGSAAKTSNAYHTDYIAPGTKTDENGLHQLYAGKETSGLRPKAQRTDLGEGSWTSHADGDEENGQSWSGPPGHRAPELQVPASSGSDGSEAYEKPGRKITLTHGKYEELGPNSSTWSKGGYPTLTKVSTNARRPGVITRTDSLGPEDPDVTATKPWNPEVSEIDEQVSKLVKLPVLKQPIRTEISKGTTERLSTWNSGENTSEDAKVCCPCCKEEGKLKEPVLGGGYVEAVASPREIVRPASLPSPNQPIPIGQQQPVLLNPSPALRPVGTGYGPSTAYTNLPGSFFPSAQQSPIIGQYTPSQYSQAPYAPSYGGSYGGACPCAPPPQICCQPVSPCCLPSLPCCPPPPPMPCCPQISLCCQPIIPCCLPQIQICLPTIPLCFRGCPSCPCRRRRSVDDPRYKRSAFCHRRVKRHGNENCRQCSSNVNPLTQTAGGCGTCNGSHKRVKRLGCLPCGRKKREAELADQHSRQKRSCLPCPGGRKKRDASCRSCSLLQTFITRQKRTINCGPCGGRKKRSPDNCPCAAKAAEAPRMKRAVEDYDGPFTCDRKCCDYSRCAELRAKKLDLKL